MKAIKYSLFSFWLLSWGLAAHAQTTPLPHLINFQSVLTDTAGVPLFDGLYDVVFRVVDANGEVNYQETQKLETVSGVVSAMVGAQGDMGPAIFDPISPKFLEVEVLGNGPAKTMEIVTVPYSLFAEQALNVAPQSIGAEAIQPGSITRELLSEALLSDLEGTPAGAGEVGVEASFLYSRGTTVQTVLKDLDTAIHQRQINMERERVALNTRIDTETTTRQSEDTRLQGAIDTEVAARQLMNTQLQTSIGQEREERTADVISLRGQINSVNASLSESEDATDSRLDSVEQNIDTLIAPPRVVAAGIVSVPNSWSTELEWGYNVSSVSNAVQINFQNSIPTPYIVLLTPVSNTVGLIPPWAHSMTSASFSVTTDAGHATRFHFVVFR